MGIVSVTVPPGRKQGRPGPPSGGTDMRIMNNSHLYTQISVLAVLLIAFDARSVVAAESKTLKVQPYKTTQPDEATEKCAGSSGDGDDSSGSCGPSALAEWLTGLDARGYDPLVRPTAAASVTKMPPPEKVTLQIFVHKLFDIDERNMHFSILGFFRRWWTDERLKLPGAGIEKLSLKGENITIWQPDTYFENAMTYTATNEALYVELATGLVTSSRQVLTTLTCLMDFRLLPFDQQHCTIDVGAYSQDGSQVVLEWKKDGKHGVDDAGIDSRVLTKNGHLQVQTPQWSIYVKDSTEDVESYEGMSSSGYAHAIINFALTRESSFYLTSICLPAMLFAVTSYGGSWVTANSPPARVAIGLIPILTTVNLMSSMRAGLPKIHYATRLDTFLIGILGFEVWNFLIFCAVSFCLMREGKVAAQLAKAAAHADRDDDAEDPAVNTKLTRKLTRSISDGWHRSLTNQWSKAITPKKSVKWSSCIEITNRWLWPVAFSIYCIVMLTIRD